MNTDLYRREFLSTLVNPMRMLSDLPNNVLFRVLQSHVWLRQEQRQWAAKPRPEFQIRRYSSCYQCLWWWVVASQESHAGGRQRGDGCHSQQAEVRTLFVHQNICFSATGRVEMRTEEERGNSSQNSYWCRTDTLQENCQWWWTVWFNNSHSHHMKGFTKLLTMKMHWGKMICIYCIPKISVSVHVWKIMLLSLYADLKM